MSPMDKIIQTHFDNAWKADRALQNEGYTYLLKATDVPVDWAYEVWDQVVARLKDIDNHNRAIAAQLLSNLAKSDPQDRMAKDFKALLAVTRDEKFVTARHSLQALWNVGLAGKKQQKRLLDGLAHRFSECATEKNATLIRYDIAQCLRNLYDAVHDEKIKAKALELIETEPDLKYRKKYASVWREKSKTSAAA